MIQNKRAVHIPELTRSLYNMSIEELEELRERIQKRLDENEKILNPEPPDLHTDLDEIEFADDILELTRSLHLMSIEELKELREKLQKILDENEKILNPEPPDLHTDLDEIEFADDILSTAEAEIFAKLFDEMGEEHNAELMYDYINKMGNVKGDIVKQAGLFGNLLDKLKGFGKRVFFKVYRELYNEAKEAQKLLDDRIDQITETYDNIKKDLRYHDLEGWRGGIHALNLSDGGNITKNFDISYGKLVQYLGLTGKGKDKETSSQIGKLPDVGEVEEVGEEKPEGQEIETPELKQNQWGRETPGASKGWNEIARNIAYSPSKGAIRFSKKYFDYLLGKHLSTDGAGNVKYWSSYSEDKQPMQGKIKNMMGDNVWKMEEDEDFVYLNPTERGEERGAPPVKTEEEEEFKSPVLPKPEEEIFQRDIVEERLFDEPPEVPEEEEEDGFKEEPKLVKTPAPEEEAEEIEEVEEVEEAEEVEEVEETEEPVKTEKPKSPLEELVKKQPRKMVWVEKARPQMMKDKELWTRFTKVYPETAKRYVSSGKGVIVQDPATSSFLDKAVPRKFPGHAANVTKVLLPTDLEKRKQFVEMAENNWARENRKTSRIERLKDLYKESMKK